MESEFLILIEFIGRYFQEMCVISCEPQNQNMLFGIQAFVKNLLYLSESALSWQWLMITENLLKCSTLWIWKLNLSVATMPIYKNHLIGFEYGYLLYLLYPRSSCACGPSSEGLSASFKCFWVKIYNSSILNWPTFYLVNKLWASPLVLALKTNLQ